MQGKESPQPFPTGPVVRLILCVVLIVLTIIRGAGLGIPVAARIGLGLALLLIGAEQVRRIVASRRPPVEERVNKHPLGLE